MDCIFCNKSVDSEEERYELCSDDALLGCLEYLLGSDYCCLSCGEKFLAGISENPNFVFEKLNSEGKI